MSISIDCNILKKLFQNVYFINGTAYAGKTTMVKLLAEKYDGISCGENYKEHYDAFANSGFFTFVRNEHSTVEEALAQLEKHFLLI